MPIKFQAFALKVAVVAVTSGASIIAKRTIDEPGKCVPEKNGR